MEDSFALRVGGVVSADIAVPEHERELRFYAHVLTTGRTPLWRDDLMNSAGQPIIGLGERTAEYADLPLQWMPHIQVADVAASAERALALGGTEILHGKDAEGVSLWAGLSDPSGVAFGVIPVVGAGEMPPAAHEGETGRIVSLDLALADAAGARSFYRDVIGWSPREVEERIQGAGDGDAAREPVWVIHLPVADLEESLRRVEAEGGAILETLRAGEGASARALVQDPVGVRFGLRAG
ncbi:MAG: VOC family protein [Planctomycetota bacterium]